MKKLLLAVALCAACGDSSNPSPDAATGLNYTFQFLDGGPLVGVTVCIYPGMTSCQTTDATGRVIITGVPKSSEVMFSFTRTGYLSELVEYTTGTSDVASGYTMVSNTKLQNAQQAVGMTIDLQKGLIHAEAGRGASVGPTTGVTMTISPTSGNGPYYTDANDMPTTTATATGTNGDSVFINVPAGDYQVTYADPSGACMGNVNSWASGNNVVRVRVAAGYLTNVGAMCP